jgi:hypothetical protein
MSRKSYPQLGRSSQVKGWINNPKGAPKCDVIECEAAATRRVEIEVNWFRGDDECCRACEAHKAAVPELLAGFDKREAEKEIAREKQKAVRGAAEAIP